MSGDDQHEPEKPPDRPERPDMLVLALCCRGALFGMAIEVFFESTTPLLHLLGCLKIAGRSKGRLYFLAGESSRCTCAAKVCKLQVGQPAARWSAASSFPAFAQAFRLPCLFVVGEHGRGSASR